MMGSLLQITLALGLVLGLIAAAAWLLQRLYQPRAGQGALIQLHASAALARARLVEALQQPGRRDQAQHQTQRQGDLQQAGHHRLSFRIRSAGLVM